MEIDWVSNRKDNLTHHEVKDMNKSHFGQQMTVSQLKLSRDKIAHIATCI